MAKVILDISHWEKVTDWKKLKENVSFLIFKSTEGTSFLDPDCYRNIENCEKYGIPYWIYCFLKKGNELAQAKYMVQKVHGEIGKNFVGYCIDVEQGNSASNVQKALDYIKTKSKKTMIYTAHHHYDLYKTILPKRGDNCAWWEPRYSSVAKPHSGVDLWQYSESYKCSYISGQIDINRIYGKKTLSWFTNPQVETAKKVTTVTPVEKVISVAKGEVGYLEKDSNHNLGSKTANAGSKNYTKYGSWIGANGDYWCASFISWVFYKAFGYDKGKKLLGGTYSAACETIRSAMRTRKRYVTSSPKAGDVIFFSGTRHSGANHIGLVYKVDSSKVYTIEGNTSGANGVIDNGGGVAKKSYAKSYTRILGYGRPDYTIVSGTSTAKTTITYYPKYSGKSGSIIDALKAVGVKDTSLANRNKIASKNGIKNYSGTVAQNVKLLTLLKSGKLIKS